MARAHFAVVPAAGSGSRFGGAQPKQYERIGARSVLEHAVRALARQDGIEAVFVALAPGDCGFAQCRWSGLGAEIVPLFCGGPTRACTVFNALMAIRDRLDDADWVLVHDAARPCVSRAELERLMQALAEDEVGGLLALPVADTLKRAGADERIVATEPREGLWRALTPQMFRYRLLVEALRRTQGRGVTDEAAALEALGLRPRLVAGAATNIKLTYAEDIELAAAILARRGDE
jgi:2-C-methyl-D-erythritol 4-phosphate cytidylyltransferase